MYLLSLVLVWFKDLFCAVGCDIVDLHGTWKSVILIHDHDGDSVFYEF